MKLVLLKDVKDLGKAGQVINASEGYARNFLIPRKLAIIADAGALKAVDTKKRVIELKGEKLLEEAKLAAERIKDIKLVISAKVGTGTKLYGSITNHELAEELEKKHRIIIDKRKIVIPEPIKSTGQYVVPVKLHHDVSVDLHVEVVAINS